MSDETPWPVKRDAALAHARAHMKTHVRWVRFLQAGGELPAEEVGDIAHHQQSINELETICFVLRTAANPDLDGDN